MLESSIAPVGASSGTSARTAAILSVASQLPPQRVSTAEMAERFGITEEWIFSRTGIRERRRAKPDERLADYASRAGAAALERAGVSAAELDLVMVGTMTPDELTPNTSPLVAHALGARRAGAFDIGAACTAFLSGVAMGAAQIETRRADLILVIGADFISRITNWEDKRTAPLFADAVGAVVLGESRGASGAIGPIVLGADGAYGSAIIASHVDRKVHLDGHEVFRNAVRRMNEVTLEAVARAGLTLDDIDLFVFHQANARITKALGTRLGLRSERIVDCIATLGNASAATLPVALAIADSDGRLKPGARVLLAAFGAGFTWGGGVIEWGGSGRA